MTQFDTISVSLIEETTAKRAEQEWEEEESELRLKSATRETREIISIEKLNINSRRRLKTFQITSGIRV